MKFLPLAQFDVVNSALNFDTPDCHVGGGCDVYTTKAGGSDKKLYKNIDRSLETQHAAQLKFGMSLSPPQRDQMAASLNLSRSSPFGPLSDVSSRKTFAYLIATLNASHPDYDFSHVLRPADFKKERNLRKVIQTVDNTLDTVRPRNTTTVSRESSFVTPAEQAKGTGRSASESPPPNFPHMWALVDKEMMLKDCTVFSYQPVDDPFDDEAAAIWSFHYFFFNKVLKRVAYMHARGIPVVSHSSPRLRPRRVGIAKGLSASVPINPGELKRSMSSMNLDNDDDDDVASSASKRARFWLGDQLGERATSEGDNDDDDGFPRDGLLWNRSQTGELDEFAGADEYGYGGVYQDDEEELSDYDHEQMAKSPVRAMSEELAAIMEVD